MNKSTQKLINYLNEESRRKKTMILDNVINDKQDKKDMIKDATEVVFSENIVKVLMIDIDTYSKQKIIFIDFKMLSKLLNKSNLNSKEKLTVLLEFIQRNICTGILEDDHAKTINVLDIDTKKLQLTTKEVLNLQKPDYVNQLMTKPEKNLNPREIEIKEELERKKQNSKENKIMMSVIESTKIIKEHIIDNYDNYTIDDINILMPAFKNLGVDKDMRSCIKYILERNLQKKLERKNIRQKTYNLNLSQEQSSEYLTDKEYKIIKKELCNYFDFYKMTSKKQLTDEEITYCASLALKIGISKEKIKTFFKIVKREYENPIAQYNRNYDKIKYYEEKVDIKQSVTIIDEAIREIFIASSKDYKDWKELVQTELDEINNKLPKNYEYEFEKATGEINKHIKTLKK